MGDPGFDKEKRLQKLQQATVRILTNLAETDDLPWAVQMALLTIIGTTGVQTGAIRLSAGEDYAFTTQEDIDNLGKDISLNCSFSQELKLYSTSEQGVTLPCMFSRKLIGSKSFFCTHISAWLEKKVGSLPAHEPWCQKCKEFGYETTVMVPLKTAGKTLGLIHLQDFRKKAVSLEEVAFLETLSGPLGYALKHLQDREALRKREKQLKSSYEQLQAFSSRILRAQEEEKIRLSRELHDEVGQALTAVKIDLQVIKEGLKEKGVDFQERLSESIRLVAATLELVRKQAVSLRPPALDHMGLVAAVQGMAQGFSHRTGIEAQVAAKGKIMRVSNEMETALFRCIQESLTNVARHSGAKKVTIEFKYLPESISVNITDDGKGFQQDALDKSPDRIGLTGMRERVKLLGGNLQIDSKPHSGTRIKIKIPLA